MSALAYYLEREGLLTTGISLVRENTESMRPPRALWVPFPLGRPLGKPADPDFQLDVIEAALNLLQRPRGPVLEDYPHDAPLADASDTMSCPVSFAKSETADDTWATRLSLELQQLQPWHELSLRRRNGRTLVGISKHSLAENLATLGGHLVKRTLPTDITWLKRAIEDLKAFYLEALTAQPGSYDGNIVQEQFWQETRLGAAILALSAQFQSANDDRLKLVARLLAPREAVGAATGPEEAAQP